jgi:hypothetical protein
MLVLGNEKCLFEYGYQYTAFQCFSSLLEAIDKCLLIPIRGRIQKISL